MLRAVLDPNVLVSALITPQGTCAKLVLAVRDGRFELVTSPLLLGELERVLRRDRFRRYVSESEVDQYLVLLERESLALPDPDGPSEPLGVDPGDEFLLTLARAANAVLVSGDSDLHGLDPRIPAIRPRAFLDSLD